MLEIAQKYTQQLSLKFADTVYDLKYMFYHCAYADDYVPSTTTWNKHEFVSLDKKGDVIGYLSYNINRNDYKATDLCIINFTDNKLMFGRDVAQVIDDIFMKYQFRKLNYEVVCGNPIEPTYDKLTLQYGGRIIGMRLQDTKMIDGNMYDRKYYEIFREDYIKNRKKRKEKN